MLRSAGIVMIALAAMALHEGAFAQAAERSITVMGRGEASGPPDQAKITAGVQTRAEQVVEAANENQAIVERIMQALREQGIESRHIQTANYSIWPEQRHEPRQEGPPRIAGYRVSNMVNVTVNDMEKVGDVIAAVTNAGANSIQGIHFSVEDSEALEADARRRAMADARTRANALAELAEVELGEVLAISTTGGPVWPMMSARGFEAADAAVAAPSISPGQQSVSVQVQVSFAIR